jgi:hypothetical protein
VSNLGERGDFSKRGGVCGGVRGDSERGGVCGVRGGDNGGDRGEESITRGDFSAIVGAGFFFKRSIRSLILGEAIPSIGALSVGGDVDTVVPRGDLSGDGVGFGGSFLGDFCTVDRGDLSFSSVDIASPIFVVSSFLGFRGDLDGGIGFETGFKKSIFKGLISFCSFFGTSANFDPPFARTGDVSPASKLLLNSPETDPTLRCDLFSCLTVCDLGLLLVSFGSGLLSSESFISLFRAFSYSSFGISFLSLKLCKRANSFCCSALNLSDM